MSASGRVSKRCSRVSTMVMWPARSSERANAAARCQSPHLVAIRSDGANRVHELLARRGDGDFDNVTDLDALAAAEASVRESQRTAVR